MSAPGQARISPRRLAQLVDGFHRDPAYRGLAEALRLAIGDGRIGHGVRLPGERELTGALAVSRTTVSRAYALLRDQGYATARQGSGTDTRLPGGPAAVLDRALSPRTDLDPALGPGIDLNCAAASASPAVAAAYAAALTALPAYLSGHGYYPAGLPDLQRAVADRFTAEGLPTVPDQIMITSGALAATAVAADALVRPGDRVLVESPAYPNAPRTLTRAGARLVPHSVDAEAGWDLDALAAVLRSGAAPRLAYLCPDFQNPTGHLLDDAGRERLAAALARSGVTVVVDEAHRQLVLDPSPASPGLPLPLAAHVERAGGQAVVVGGLSKTVWGGLRVGWLRAPRGRVAALTEARFALDLGVPVLEQLAAVQLVDGLDTLLDEHRGRLRVQRSVLADGLREALPDWRFRTPSGGLSLWVALPAPRAVDLADRAEARGLVITPGPVLAPGGGLPGHVRLPYARPVEDLRRAVEVLGEAWRQTLAVGPGPERRRRPMVA